MQDKTEIKASFLQRNKRAIKLLISLLVMAALVVYVDASFLYESLINAPYEKLIPWGFFYEFMVILLWSAGFSALIKRLGKISFRKLLAVGLKLQALTLFVPGRLGDLGIVYFFRKDISIQDGTALLVVDKLISLSLITVLSVAGTFYLISIDAGYWLLASVLVIALAGMLLLAVARPWLERIFARIFPVNVTAHPAGFYGALRDCLGDYHAIFSNYIFTSARVILSGISLVLVLSWFGVSAPLGYVILVQAIAQLIVIAPVSFMGIGIVEMVNIALLSQLGIDASLILAASLASRAVQLMFLSTLFLVWAKSGQASIERGL